MAGKKIQGITLTIDGETKGLDASLRDVNKHSRDLQAELRQVDNLLKFNPGNTELIAQKQGLLGQQVESTAKKLEGLRSAQQEVEQAFARGDLGEKKYREFQRELIKTESQLSHFESKLKSVDDGNSLNEVDKELEEISKETKTAGDALDELDGALAGLGASIGASKISEDALDLARLDTTINVTMDLDKESKAAVESAVRDVGTYGIEATEALSGVRKQWALNKDATDEANAEVAKGAAYLATVYEELDFGEVVQEANEVAAGLNISNEEALGLFNTLLRTGFPPSEIDIIAEYGRQLKDAGYNAAEVQGIISSAAQSGTWDIDNLLDGLKEGRIRLAEFGVEVPAALSSLLEQTSISTEQMMTWGAAVAGGGEAGKNAMTQVAQALLNVDDKVLQNAIGTQIYGTLWEEQGATILQTILGMDEGMVTLGDSTTMLQDNINEFNSDPMKMIQTAISEIYTALEPLLLLVAEVIAAFASWAAENPALTSTIVAIVAIVGLLVGGLAGLGAVAGLIKGALAVLAVSFGALTSPVGLVIAAVAGLAAIAITLMKKWGPVTDFFSGLWNGIVSIFTGSYDEVDAETRSSFGSMTDTVGKAMPGMGEKVKTSLGDMIDYFKETWGDIKDFLSGIDLSAIGGNIMSGLIKGITGQKSSLFGSMTSTIGGMIGLSRKKLDINSPSGVYEDIGMYTAQGLINSLNKMRGRVIAASKRMIDGSIVDPREDYDLATPGGGSVGSRGSGSSGTGDTDDTPFNITVQNMTVRDDNDITLIARELFRLQQQKQRGKGGV